MLVHGFNGALLMILALGLFQFTVARCQYGSDWTHVASVDFARAGLTGQWVLTKAETTTEFMEGTAATQEGFSEFVVTSVEPSGTPSLDGRNRFAVWTPEMALAGPVSLRAAQDQVLIRY